MIRLQKEILYLRIIGDLICLSGSILAIFYLWTDFETKGTYELPMTQGWLEKYKIFKFKKNTKKF